MDNAHKGRLLPGSHLVHVDGLRALAALFVLMHHAYMFPDKPVWYLKWLNIFWLGHNAVVMFIVISGFCLMLPVIKNSGTMKEGYWGFIKKRIWRILPAYYLTIFLSLFLIYFFIHEKSGGYWDDAMTVSGKSIVTHLLLIHDLAGDACSINNVLWSIAVEWRIYFLFPLFILCWKTLGPNKTTILSILLFNILAIVSRHYLKNNFATHFFALFVMGMWAASVVYGTDEALAKVRKWNWNLIALAGSVIWLTDSVTLTQYLLDFCVAAWTVALLISTSTSKNAASRFLSMPALVWIGGFSYSIYLIHSPLLQLFRQYVFAPLNMMSVTYYLLHCVVVVPFCILMAYIFSWAGERPFVKPRQKIDADVEREPKKNSVLRTQ